MEYTVNPFVHSLMQGVSGVVPTPGVTHVDAIRHAQMQVEVNRMAMAGGMTRQAARPFAENAHKLIDDVVVSVGAEQLGFVTALIAAGLVRSLPNWLGVPLYQWDMGSEHGQAVESMDLSVQLLNSRRQLTPDSIPVFALLEGFEFNVREGLVAQQSGAGIETTNIRQAVLNINAGAENQSINGSQTVVGGSSAPGLLNATNAGSFAFTGGLKWTAAGHLPEHKKDDVQAGIQVLNANRRRGPYFLVVNTEYNLVLDDDYDTNNRNQGTIRDALERMRHGSPAQPLEIVVTDAMPADKISIVQKSVDVIDVVLGQTPTAITWTPDPGFVTHGVIVACMPVRTKTDAGDFSGIANGAEV